MRLLLALSFALSLPVPCVVQAQAPAVPPAAPGPLQPASSGPVQANPALKARDTSVDRGPQTVMIHNRPYHPPTQRQLFIDYLNDSYGLPALARSMARSLYGQARGLPTEWDYEQRLGSAVAITAINGNVRYGMEEIFHEDLRYIPCHGCNAKHKIENVLLAEFTARHDSDGHRFFTLTPTVADFSGPIIAHSIWYPAGFNPFGGVVATRTVFATRIGGHLFREFVWERRHSDPKEAGD